ncbi:MAG: carbohydrate ABC transporter permease, partial [Chloroflexota bacterium]
MNERQNSERSLPGTAVALPRVSHSGSLGRLARYSTPYWYIAPFFIIFFAFFAYPVIYSFYVSLHTWSGQGAMTWVGWDNYNFVLSDNYFMEALQVSGLMWLSVPFTTVLSLVIAVIWNHPRFWGRNVVLILFLLPTVISIVAVSL